MDQPSKKNFTAHHEEERRHMMAVLRLIGVLCNGGLTAITSYELLAKVDLTLEKTLQTRAVFIKMSNSILVTSWVNVTGLFGRVITMNTEVVVQCKIAFHQFL